MLRRTPLKKSAGTRIPVHTRHAVLARDHYRCVGETLGWASHQPKSYSQLTLDHVRASHGMGMKSETVASNLVTLDFQCHEWKTRNGREARPLLLRYLARFYPEAADAA